MVDLVIVFYVPNALLSGKQKWRVFATAKQVPLLVVRWSYL